MKRIIVVVLFAINMQTANANTCIATDTCTSGNCTDLYVGKNCTLDAGPVRYYGGIYKVQSCASCNAGYAMRTIGSLTIPDCSTVKTAYKTCDIKCDNCISIDWTDSAVGYQRYTSKVCNSDSSCSVSYSYRCAVGYWGTSSNGTSGCSLCPEWTGVYTNSARTTNVRGTSSVGTTEITGCYVASGTYYDVTGTFNTNGNCPYEQ